MPYRINLLLVGILTVIIPLHLYIVHSFQVLPDYLFDRWKLSGTQKWRDWVKIAQMIGVEPALQAGLLATICDLSTPKASCYQDSDLYKKASCNIFTDFRLMGFQLA